MNEISHYDTNNAVLSVDGIMEQVTMIQKMMERAMKKDEHYGVIPGTSNKPSLLKPGAEKLAMMFRLAPEYQITKTDGPKGHCEYSIICTLRHINRGEVWGQGVGSCSTMESKFRYRWDKTGKPVPKEYWDNKDKSILGGDSFTARKSGGSWEIYQRVEHDNPADYYNTCLKMAKKRAMVDAILTATAASDIFTQDIEDLVENGVIDVSANPKANVTPPPTKQQREITIEKERQEEPEREAEPPAESNMLNFDENSIDGLRNKIRDEAASAFPNPPSFSLWLKTLTANEEKGFRGIESVDQSKSIPQLRFVLGSLRKKVADKGK